MLDDEGQPVLTEKLDRRGKPIPTESEPQPDEYRSKPVWQRAVVISAGVIFNFVFACLVYGALYFAYGRSYTPAENVPLAVAENTIASEMGLRTGDRVVGVNGEPVESFESVFTMETLSTSPLRLTVQRGSDRVEVEGPDALASRLSREATAVEREGGEASLAVDLRRVASHPAGAGDGGDRHARRRRRAPGGRPHPVHRRRAHVPRSTPRRPPFNPLAEAR